MPHCLHDALGFVSTVIYVFEEIDILNQHYLKLDQRVMKTVSALQVREKARPQNQGHRCIAKADPESQNQGKGSEVLSLSHSLLSKSYSST